MDIEFRLRSQLRTVEDILLCGENLEIGSDSDISDASQISNTVFKHLKHFCNVVETAKLSGLRMDRSSFEPEKDVRNY